jgi:flagellar basal-body rod modification protein FlgD
MMTNTIGANGANTTGASDKIATSAPMDENRQMFTTLLVAQIRNQDPLEPSDPSQFVNQLSQLSQTEALQNLSRTTSASASVLQSLQVLAMGAQVGSEVSVATERVRLADEPISGSIELDSASGATTLLLTGIDGRQHPVTLPAHGPGTQSFTLDAKALGLAPGSYSIAAQTTDGSRPQVEINGRLASVRMSAGGALLLQVAGIGDVDPAAITGFHGKAGGNALAALPSTAY